MIRRLSLLIAGLLAVLFCDSVAEAQFVRVSPFGGVRVRAPFVAVDVLPYGGGTRVRAPLTSVNTGLYGYRGYRYGFYDYGLPPGIDRYRSSYPPRRRYGGPAYTTPVIPVPIYPDRQYVPRSSPSVVYPQRVDPVPVDPTPVYRDPTPTPSYELARPVTSDTNERLRRAAMRLQQHFAQQQDGDIWLNYLQPQSIVDAIDRGENPDSLQSLLTNYNGVLANPSLTHVRRASGFTETRVLLERYIESQPAVSGGMSGREASNNDESNNDEGNGGGPSNNEPLEDNPPPPPQPDIEELPAPEDVEPVSL